jgi:fluoroquinolone resistance protein
MSLSECNLGLAQLRGLEMKDTTLNSVNFDQADLSNATFENAYLEECSLRESIVTDANFQGADLRSSDLGGLQMSDARRFKGAIISKSQAADLLGQLGLKVV